MRTLARYFAYSARKQVVQICLTVLLPLLIPYIFAGVLQLFTAAPPPPSVTGFDLASLPAPAAFPDYSGDFMYFAVSRGSGMSRRVVDHLVAANHLGPEARTMEFDDTAAARHYFAAANIGARLGTVDLDRAREIFVGDLQSNWGFKGDVGETFIDSLRETYKGIYNLSEADFAPPGPEVVFLYIDVIESAERVGSLPRNVTVHMVYNTTVLDNLLKASLDPVSQRFGNLQMQPFWTGYSLTLQKQVDEFLVREYAGVEYDIQFDQLNEIPGGALTIQNLMLFEMSVLFAWAVQVIFATLAASYNRADRHVVLRRLGVTEGQFWLANGAFVLALMLATVLLQVVVWHYTGVLPFGGITIGYCLFEALVLALQFTAAACLFAALLGTSKTAPVLAGCILAFVFLFLPSMFHVGFFGGTTLFDPSLVPQWGTWLAMAVCPLFGVFGLMDSMTSGLDQTVAAAAFDNYEWRPAASLTPLEYLFTDYKRYTSTLRLCAVSDSGNSRISVLGKCAYYQPLYGYVILLNALQAALAPALLCYIAYTKREKANRGLPLLFPFSARFWRSARVRPSPDATEAIQMRNVSVVFDRKEKRGLGGRSAAQRIFFRRNFVLRGMSLSLGRGQICSLVGESNQGKSTVLNVLAGEVPPTDMAAFARRRRFRRCGYREPATFDEVAAEGSRDQVLSWLSDIGEPACTLFGGVDMLDPYNAYFVKPFVGYCPQDFSNVWMGMSVYRNVQFSLRMRLESTGDTMEDQEAYIQVLLARAGLGDTDVQRRAARRLSGGMLRRLAFCNALAGSNHILLLDEVSAGVDPVIKRQIWEILRFVKGTVLLTSHDMAEIGQMTQNITVINEGRAVIDNVNQFELRRRYNQFSIDLYKGESVVAGGDFDALQQAIPFRLERQAAQQHVLRAKVAQPLTTDELLRTCDSLDDFVGREGFDDYNIDKCSLSDIYVDLIQYRKHTASQEGAEIRPRRPSKFAALLRKSFYVDFRFTAFPLIFILTVVAIVLCICTYLFYSLFSSVFDMST